MQRKLHFTSGVIAVLFILPLWMASCPTRPEGEKDIIRHFVPMSELFNIGSQNYGANGNAGNAGWLEKNPATGLWALAAEHNDWTMSRPDHGPYYGVRLFSIDRNLPLKRWMDVSAYDGITFRYRTNMMNTESRMLDCMFWWAYTSQDYFHEWNWEGGFENPDPELGYKEVIIPFYQMAKWGIPQNITRPCNDTTKFNALIFTNFRFDGRSPAREVPSQNYYWLEIVDFAFFNFQ